MLSTQWEVVTKSKKQRNLEKKVEAHTEKKRIALAGPRLEEILPQHQLKSIFSKSTKEKVNKSPKKTASSTSNKSSPALKSKSNSNNESNKKQSSQAAPPPPPKPKNLETALAKVSMDELNDLMEQRAAYLGNELYWLRQIAAYINSILPFDSDPVFSGKAIQYPTNVVPKTMKTALIENFKDVGESSLSYFFDTLLTRLTEELYNNKPVVGYKLLLQIVGQNWPVVCSNSLAKTAILRNSYQNRSNIGLSILWGVGQGGYRDINIGVKVWQNIMLPVIEMKSYSRFVVDYIEKVLSSPDSEKQKLVLSQTDFFTTYNALKAKYSIPRECQQILTNSSQLFLKKYTESSPKLSNIFLTLFRDIKSAQNQLEINGCIDCLINGDECFKVWKMNYKKNVLPSNMLLRQIYQQWDGSAVKLRDSKAFDEFLVAAAQLNLELDSSKKRDPALDELLSLFGNVQDKSTQQKKKTAAGKSCSSCGCKWFLGSLVLLAIIVGVLHYDTNTNGKGVFANSATGKVLKNAGLLPHVEKGYVFVMTNTARGYKWAEQRVPGYVKPAGQLACDLYKVVRNAACNTCGLVKDYAVTKWPVVSAALEQYIPGLPKKLEDLTVSTRVFVSDSVGKITEFFKVNVFVGSLSPENLGKALNQTQVAVAKYVNKFSQEMDAWAKRK